MANSENETDWNELGQEILLNLFEAGLIRTWYRHQRTGWRLVSGDWSPFYINLRPLVSHPALLRHIGKALGELIQQETKVDRLVGVAMAGIPLALAISFEMGTPMCYTRKIEGVKTVQDFDQKIKEYGQHDLVEGVLMAGEQIGIVDDLVTTFGSKLLTIEQVKYEMAQREIGEAGGFDVVVLLDREQGAQEEAQKQGIGLHALIPFKSRGLDWLKPHLWDIEYEIISDYLQDPAKYQDTQMQADLAALSISG